MTPIVPRLDPPPTPDELRDMAAEAVDSMRGVAAAFNPVQAAFDPVHRPSHYAGDRWPIECIDVVRHMAYVPGCAFKYVWRHADKGTAVQDLSKAAQYLEWAVEDRMAPLLRWYRNEVNLAGGRYAVAQQVDSAVAHAVGRSLDVPSSPVYSALSLIVRYDYAAALELITVVRDRIAENGA